MVVRCGASGKRDSASQPTQTRRAAVVWTLFEPGSQADETVLGSDFLHHLHHHEVFVDLRRRDAKVGSAFILIGRNLTMPRVERDAHLESLVLHLFHARQRHWVERCHVVVRELLATRRVGAHDCTAGELQIGALVVGLAWHQEKLLLEANHWLDRLGLVTEQLEQPRARGGHGL
eukprot:1549195-Prymnesium_polylepis.1